MNSRRKGARGEREAAKELTRIGFGAARRGRQYNGLEGRDVICDALPGVHIEVKRVEALRLYDALSQAAADANGACPVVMHKKNRESWVFIVSADCLLSFARAVLTAVEEKS